YSLGTMVIRRDRERPAAEQAIVIGQQLCGSLGFTEGIEPLIDGRIDAQEAPPGGAHELPEPGGSYLGVSAGIERGVHGGERGQSGRAAQRGQHARHMRLPWGGTHQSGPKAIRLPELEAPVIGRAGEPRRAGILAPESDYVTLLVVRRGRATPQTQQ